MQSMQSRTNLATLLAIGIVATLFSACVLAARGEERSTSKNASAADELAYRFAPGEVVRTKVVHLATVDTKIKGVAQSTRSRTLSTRVWKIREVDSAGNTTFDNLLERVEMWNSVEGRKESHYDSDTDKTPSPEFTQVAASIGKVLATIKIDRYGRIQSRTNAQPQFNPGIGELTSPFPPKEKQPLAAGDVWSIPEEVKLTLEDGMVKRIQTQQQYKLDKIEAGVATISVETQVLTPVNDPKIQSQLVQRLQRGTIRFDVDAGRLLYKQLDIDQQVFGFSGNDSHMQYLARFTEEPLSESQRTANNKPSDAAHK
jgi:hypothetical protein